MGEWTALRESVKQKNQRIIAAFQRQVKSYDSTETDLIPDEEVKNAIASLGNRDLHKPFRRIMEKRIAKTEG